MLKSLGAVGKAALWAVLFASAVWHLARLPAHGDEPCATSGAEIHYAPDEDLEAIDVRELSRAERTLDVAAYVLTDRAVATAIGEAAERGVAVRVWQDGDFARKVGEADLARQLGARAGLTIRYKPGGGPIMHLKGYCVDGETLRTGSANFSHSGETEQDNDLLLVRGPGACAGFEAKFARVWGAP